MSRDPLIEALRKRREANGMSQEQAAELARVSLKTYQRIERGESDMKMSRYRLLVKAMKLTDLDLALDTLGEEGTTPWDVAAAARTLSPEIRSTLVTFIMMIYRNKVSDD